MDKIKIVFSRRSNILDIWFDDPKKEAYCSETGDEVILRKDKSGNVIGLEILNFIPPGTLVAGRSKLPADILIHDF